MRKFTKVLLGGIAAIALALGGVVSYAAYTAPLGFSIFPYTPVTQPVTNLTDTVNELLALINSQVAAFPPQNQGTQFSGFGGVTNLNLNSTGATPATTGANPIVQDMYVDVAGLGNFTSTIENSGGYVMLQGVTGKKIFPVGAGPTIMTSGTTATATSIDIDCQTSSNKIVKFPIALLTTQSVVGIMTSGGLGNGGAVPQVGLMNGCAAGDGVILTYTGSAPTTTSDYYINMPYIVQ